MLNLKLYLAKTPELKIKGSRFHIMINPTDEIAIIGLGRLGSALAISLHRSGFSINGLIDRNHSILKPLVRLVKAEVYSDKIIDLKPVAIIFIAVPDDELNVVVNELQDFIEHTKIPKYVYHTSGAVTSDIFDPIRAVGVAGASFHPIQTFSGKKNDWRKFNDIYIGLEGDASALMKASAIIKRLNSFEIMIPKQYKGIYHLACTFASNYLIALIAVVIELFKKMNFSEQETLNIIYPMLLTTVENLKSNGIEEALTGPISRGDWGTIKKHLKILSDEFPDYQSLYRIHGNTLIELKTVIDKLSVEKLNMIRQLLKGEDLENA